MTARSVNRLRREPQLSDLHPPLMTDESARSVNRLSEDQAHYSDLYIQCGDLIIRRRDYQRDFTEEVTKAYLDGEMTMIGR